MQKAKEINTTQQQRTQILLHSKSQLTAIEFMFLFSSAIITPCPRVPRVQSWRNVEPITGDRSIELHVISDRPDAVAVASSSSSSQAMVHSIFQQQNVTCHTDIMRLSHRHNGHLLYARAAAVELLKYTGCRIRSFILHNLSARASTTVKESTGKSTNESPKMAL